MLRIGLLIFIFFVFFDINISFGELNYTKSQRLKIMEDFKKEQYQNIYFGENILLNDDLNFFDTKVKINSLQNEREDLLEKRKNLENTHTIIDNRIKDIKNTIKNLDDDIKNSETEISLLSKNIVSTFKNIKDLEKDISLLQKEVLNTKEVLLEYISHIYKKYNLVFEKGDIDSIKSMFLYGGNLGDIVLDLHFDSVMELAGQNLLEKYRSLLRKQFVKKLDLKRYKKELVALRKQELLKKKSLEEKKQFRVKILTFTQNKSNSIEEFILKNKDQEKKLKIDLIRNRLKLKSQIKEFLKKYNCEYVENFNDIKLREVYFEELEKEKFVKNSTETGALNKEAFDKKNCMLLNKIIKLESMLSPIGKESKNSFSWPVEPKNGLSAFYKDPSYYDEIGTTHEAIDIKVPQGTDIIAPRDGYITFVKPPIDETYSYVVLKHADGFVTVYGHVSEVLFDKYEYIKAGEVFARTGGEIGTFGAGYITTGPHLHFEVFKDKEYKDPLEYLDLTYLGVENLPNEQKYFLKFMEDFYDRYGFEYENKDLESKFIFTLSGATEIERQKDLLSKYATSDFNNWNMWVEEALSGEIDPSFVMCIGLAETGLGRNLKSAFNVGNVGNVDSGWTWDLPNARSGIYWIVKTLNNDFLSGYDSMDKLSRYGNKSGPVYASSPFDWHKNINRCLSSLKNQYIPDDFKFRLKNF